MPLENIQLDENERNQPQEGIPEIDKVTFEAPVNRRQQKGGKQKEFASFVESSLYDIKNVDYDGDTRASCAAGLHGKNINWYKNTILPMKDRMTPISDCKIYHMTNNYVDADHSGINKFGTILFDGCVE